MIDVLIGLQREVEELTWTVAMTLGLQPLMTVVGSQGRSNPNITPQFSEIQVVSANQEVARVMSSSPSPRVQDESQGKQNEGHQTQEKGLGQTYSIEEVGQAQIPTRVGLGPAKPINQTEKTQNPSRIDQASIWITEVRSREIGSDVSWRDGKGEVQEISEEALAPHFLVEKFPDLWVSPKLLEYRGTTNPKGHIYKFITNMEDLINCKDL